jgi:hypothetical protein
VGRSEHRFRTGHGEVAQIQPPDAVEFSAQDLRVCGAGDADKLHRDTTLLAGVNIALSAAAKVFAEGVASAALVDYMTLFVHG